MAFSALRRAAERSSKLCCGMVETAGVWTISLKGNGYKRTIQKHTFGVGGWRIQYEHGAIRCVTYSTRFLLGTLYVLYVFVYIYIFIHTFLCTWESFGTVIMRVFVGAGRNLIVRKLQWHHGHAFRTSKHSRLDNGHFDAILKMSIVYGLWYLFSIVNVFSLRLAHEEQVLPTLLALQSWMIDTTDTCSLCCLILWIPG